MVDLLQGDISLRLGSRIMGRCLTCYLAISAFSAGLIRVDSSSTCPAAPSRPFDLTLGVDHDL